MKNLILLGLILGFINSAKAQNLNIPMSAFYKWETFTQKDKMTEESAVYCVRGTFYGGNDQMALLGVYSKNNKQYIFIMLEHYIIADTHTGRDGRMRFSTRVKWDSNLLSERMWVTSWMSKQAVFNNTTDILKKLIQHNEVLIELKTGSTEKQYLKFKLHGFKKILNSLK